MRTRIQIAAGTVALCVIATLTVSCEDSDITAPAGSSITVIASPATVQIDQDAGETEGTVSIIAQLLGENGVPLSDVSLFFTSSGGLLNSALNICVNQTCSLSDDSCVTDADCPFVPPESVKTDDDGIAVDSLTLRLIEDPDSVDVTVQSSSSSTTISVPKIVNLGPVDARANIVAVPPNGQRTGVSFSFDGTGSTFDPLVNLTCYEWTITSNNSASDEVIRGSADSIITLTRGDVGDRAEEQDLTVQLRVSDRTDFVCNDTTTPPSSAFSLFGAVLSYQIRCDFTDPSVDAGSNKFESLTGQASVSVGLTAIGFDLEDPDLTYLWDCGTEAQNSVPGQSVTCNYDTTGVFTATVTARNACTRSSSDSVTVTINP